MYRALFLLLISGSLTPSAPCQTGPPEEEQTMKAVLLEIRQLRQDLHAVAGAARKAQIVIYRLHFQQNALSRATERLDMVQAQITQMEYQKKYQTDQLRNLEDARDKAQDDEQKTQLEAAIKRTKEAVEECTAQQQELRLQASELEINVRSEQAKWDQLTAELDQIENSLDTATLQAAAKR